ncbi:MAG TPA: protein kinase [Vicinamibacterales bacterium]|nr:protein kinase [Vicinamibacterales bacterium]
MTDWSELKDAFWALSDLDPAEQSSRLAALKTSNPDLHGRLTELLAAETQGDPFSRLFQAEPLDADRRPTRIGGHDIVGVLGSGGMGEVYRAHDSRLQRDVAIKILPVAVAGDRERLMAFEREARVLASLNHPHIAQVFGLDESAGAPALIMELVEGPTLADVIGRQPEAPVPLSRVLTIARQIADGLDAAHEKGIVHRDLKPANIALTAEGEVKILDFGIAKRFDGVDSLATGRSATEAGAAIGTPAYMSPEQARGLPTDKRTDIWAFGCVLYELLTGRRPFAGTTASESLAAVLEQPPDFSLLPASTPTAVRSLLEHCLEKDPRRRQRDIGDVRLVLDDVLRAPADAPRAAGDAAAPSAPLWHQSRGLVGMAAAAIVVAAVLVVWVVTRVPPVAEAPAIISSVVLPAGMQLAGGMEARNAESRFAVSPDGRRLVIVAAEGSGASRLWIRSLASQGFQPLPDTQNASYPFWSADSEFVGFIAGDQIKKISVAGGTPVTVAKGGFRSSAWNGSGVILFAPGASSPLYRVPDSGGEPIRVTQLNAADGEVQHAYPSFLPDEQHFFYLGLGTKAGGALDSRGVYIASLMAGEPAKLLLPRATLARYANGRVIFLQGGRLWAQPFDPDRRELRGVPVSLAEQVGLFTAGATGVTGSFSASDGGVLAYQTASPTMSQLTWFDRTGRRIAALGAPGDYDDVALSPDGTRLAVSLMAPESSIRDLWIYDGPSGGSGQRFTFDSGDKFAPVWSPDATRILFSVLANGSVRLFVKNADGVAGARPLGADPLGLGRFATDWSRDGRLVMYIGGGRAISRSDLWTMPVEGEGVARPLVESAFVETQARFSPDGQSFAYSSNETGRFEVYVDRFPGRGARRLVSRAGGGWPRWARNGRAIYFLSATNQLMVADVSQELRVGEPRPLFEVRIRPFIRLDAYSYDVSPDGTRFLVNVLIADATPPAITVVANWNSLVP